MSGTLHRATAPLRLDFAGGWTDVAPFATRERGVVVNLAITLRAEARVEPGGSCYRIRSDDLDRTLELEPSALAQDGQLDLLKAALRRAQVPPCSLTTRCEAPPGSGLGSSGALDVALVAALDASRGVRRSPMELAEEAFELESVEAGLPGGKQDQYAAALGGCHRLVLQDGRVQADRLALDPAFKAALAAQTVICYTGVSRVSSRTIERVVRAYTRGDRQVVSALHSLVEIAEAMAEALATADLARVGLLLGSNWEQQLRLDPVMRTEGMGCLEAALRSAGSFGGKAAGAGAGGSMFFLVQDAAKGRAEAAEAGARVLPFEWAEEGVRVESTE